MAHSPLRASSQPPQGLLQAHGPLRTPSESLSARQGLLPPHSLLRTPSEPTPDPQLPQRPLRKLPEPAVTLHGPRVPPSEPPIAPHTAAPPAARAPQAPPASPAYAPPPSAKPRPFRRHGRGRHPVSGHAPSTRPRPFIQTTPISRPRPQTSERGGRSALGCGGEWGARWGGWGCTGGYRSYGGM